MNAKSDKYPVLTGRVTAVDTEDGAGGAGSHGRLGFWVFLPDWLLSRSAENL
jgi:hypothetical protein